MKISTLVIDSNEFPYQTAFPNTFSTLTSFLYPDMHQARIFQRTDSGREDLSHQINICKIHSELKKKPIMGQSYEASFTPTVVLILINEIKSRMVFVFLLLVSSLSKQECRTVPTVTLLSTYALWE